MKKQLVSLLILVLLAGCVPQINSPDEEKIKIDTLINQWHIDAAEGNLEAYFDKMTNDACFIGTDTWMGVCMSSGVLVKTKNGWKIKHYQLSIAVPNDLVQDFIKLVESYQNIN